MPANKNAGNHPSYKKLNWSPSSIQRKREYDKKYSASTPRKKYRAELNKANRQDGTYGKMTKMGMDRSHTKSGKMVLELRKLNRSRNGKSGSSKK